MTRMLPLRGGRLAGAIVSATALAGVAVAVAVPGAASGDTDAAAATSPYGYGPRAMIDCFDDRDVPYRQVDTPEGRSLEVIGSNNPDVAARTEECNQLTSRPNRPEDDAYAGAVTALIVDCLRERGYAVRVNGDDDTDGPTAGRTVTRFRVLPTEVVYTPAYSTDLDGCTDQAEAGVPIPAPAS